MSIFEHQDYRSFLKSEMAERTSRNPRFSLRAMARTLDLAPSFLFNVLNGKKNLSMDGAAKIAGKLDLPADQGEYFRLLVLKERSKSPELREEICAQIGRVNPQLKVNDLSLDHFRIISDWQHFAILASLSEPGMPCRPKDLAKALSLPQSEVELSLERMERLELVGKTDKGDYFKSLERPRVISMTPNLALRKFHQQTLQKAIESLSSQSPQQKVVGSETFAIDSNQIEEFRALADDFFNKALALAASAKKKDSVYHLGVQFFDFTPSSNKNSPSKKRNKK